MKPRYPDADMMKWCPHWAGWLRLCRVAPALNRLHEHPAVRTKPPPRRMSNFAFIQFAACFDDHTTRAALRQLFVDLLNDKDPVTRAALRDLILECIQDDLTALLIRILDQRNP